ncbi:hypothetical protein [Stenotrophomonas maltophilia]|uniref:hypothetical protein n=1 Tax=Stenotrophomonas maltophilia TaxID=40324 RepID=UPI0013DABB67|nr:hypothetical protein [Stenotrophomonas maltophilia]
MISRSCSVALAAAYTSRFSGKTRRPGSYGGYKEEVFKHELYDFLYEREYDAWFCNLARQVISVRGLKDFWLRIHTGESLMSATAQWTWDARRKLGQRLLLDLGKDHLNWYEANKNDKWMDDSHRRRAEELLRRLQLDGYVYYNGNLYRQQDDVLNVEQERSILKELYDRAGLGRREDAFKFLELAEGHFVDGKWSDSIGNVRKFFELTMSEGARVIVTKKNLAESLVKFDSPVSVRMFLESAGIFERKERETVDKLYGLLSETGAHPYMAESDQARLLRQLSLTMSQFALLRLRAACAA